MFVCCECCVLSGRGLCDELITRPEESYRLWCVVVCDLENLKNERGHDPRWVATPQRKGSTWLGSSLPEERSRAASRNVVFFLNLDDRQKLKKGDCVSQ